MQRPPPLQLLNTFEAASRLLSFSKVAVEIHVSTAAVSQQIKQLEAHLGLQLFQRSARRVELTEAGQDFAMLAQQIISMYKQGFADVMHRHARPVLRMSMSPFVAHEVLIPNLAAFQTAHPQIDLHLESSMSLVDFSHESVDAAIRLGTGQWPGLESHFLCHCQATIIAAAELIKKQPVRSTADLRHHVLIHPRHNRSDWKGVAKLMGIPASPFKGHLMMDSDLAACKAAEQGLGVTYCVFPVTWPMPRLANVISLVPPVEIPISAYFVFRPNSVKRELLMQVYQWIKQNLVTSSD